MPRGRGGYRKPANPAPVSGAGSMSARTDGGPAKPVQSNGMPYGMKKELGDQIDAVNGAPQGPAGSGASTPAPGAVPPPSIWGATERPDEPITAGAPFGPGPAGTQLVNDPAAFFRTLYEMNPTDELRALIEFVERRGARSGA